MSRLITCLTTEHDWRLVALAGIVCLLASSVTFALLRRAQMTRGGERFVWLCLCTGVAGCGIWATNFIAILAYGPSSDGGHSLGLIILSLILAIGLAGAGLSIALFDLSKWAPAVGGAVVGIGTAAMHYTAFLSMAIVHPIIWSLDLVLVSIVLGILFGSVALVVAMNRADLPHMLTGSAILSITILAVHFVAISAATILSDPDPSAAATLSPEHTLSLFVAGGVILLLATSTVAAVSDQRWRRTLGRKQSELEVALDNMAQGLSMFDKDGCVTLFNRRYAEMLNFSESSLKGRHVLDLFKELDSKGALPFDPETKWESIRSNIDAGIPPNEIVKLLGRILRVNYRFLPNGGWVTTLEDITKWYLSEEQKNIAFSLIEACPIAIAITDPARLGSPLIYANRAYSQMSGYENSEVIGCSAYSLAGSGTDRRNIDEFQRELLARSRAEARFTFHRKDGTAFLDHVIAVSVHDDIGRVIAWISFHADVTDDARHQAEAQRQKMEALGRMMGGVAHEINNMLQPIMLLGRDIIDNGKAGNEEKQQLQIMLDCSSNARGIIGDLLAFSSPRRRTLVDHDPAVLLKDGLCLIRKAIPQGTKLTSRIEGCLPEISVDPTGFLQILLNLATNAAAAMDGRGELSIVLDTEEYGIEASETVCFARFRVSDTGCGMTKEALDRAFEPFFTTKPVGQGTGLGLSVVYGLIREMDGTITIDSESGRGTTVTILIPGQRR